MDVPISRAPSLLYVRVSLGIQKPAQGTSMCERPGKDKVAVHVVGVSVDQLHSVVMMVPEHNRESLLAMIGQPRSATLLAKGSSLPTL